MEYAVRISRAEDPNAHRTRGAERAAVADQGAFRNFFDGEELGFPGQRGLHFEQLPGSLSASGRDVAVQRVTGAHHAVPGRAAAVPNGVGAGSMDLRRDDSGASQFRGDAVEVLELSV